MTGTFVKYDEDSAYLCETGYMNLEGYCDYPHISHRAGLNCSTSKNCPTSDPNVYAACKCTYNEKVPKYCSILSGNDEA